MKIGIDDRFLGTAGGFGRYTEELVKHLEKIDQSNDYLIFLTRQNFDLYQPANPKFKKLLANCRWYTLKEQLVMPWKIWRAKLDLMHFVSWNVPLLNPAPFVVTIHDLILLKYPTQRASTLSPILYWLKNLTYRFTIKRAIKKARRIIAVSEFTKKDIIENFKTAPEKIEVIYEGACPAGLGAVLAPANNQVLQKYGVKKPYLLYVGVAYPHKNLEFLIDAFRLFVKQQPAYQLVLVGENNYFYQRLKQSTPDQNVIFTGRLPDEELSAFYSQASLYLFPSLYEGFGLPALEAMTRGLPVLASNNSCLPEILGRAALYFDPHNQTELIELIKRVLADASLQNQLRAAGFEQIKKYSWTDLAQNTLQVYNGEEVRTKN